jgi:tRNA (guanine-N7-)-methyltransferase
MGERFSAPATVSTRQVEQVPPPLQTWEILTPIESAASSTVVPSETWPAFPSFKNTMVGICAAEVSICGMNESTRLPATPDEHVVASPVSPDALFPMDQPLEIEFGSGKGRFLIESGRRHPERNYLGLERSLSYYRIARDRVARSGLENVRVLRAQAEEFVAFLADSSVSAFHAYFLDPWPKKKQRKRRLLQARFFGSVFAKATRRSTFRVVTDHADYAASIEEALEDARRAGIGWERASWESEDPPPPTHYELKYRLVGREFFRFLLRKP